MHLRVGGSGLEEADAVVVGVANKMRESVLAELTLDCAVVGTRPESQARDFDVRFAKSDPIGGTRALGSQRKAADTSKRACGDTGLEKSTPGNLHHELTSAALVKGGPAA